MDSAAHDVATGGPTRCGPTTAGDVSTAGTSARGEELAPLETDRGGLSREAERHHGTARPRLAIERQITPQTKERGSKSTRPVLSPNCSRWTPALSSRPSSRFAIGVSSAYLMWRPPLSWPAPPPATTTGKFL